MGLQRQFTDFIEEKCSSVGYFEIPFVFVLGVRERSFLMPEEFTVDRSLGDGTAVDGKISTVLAGRESVNDFREMLFPDTGFAGDEHAQIRAGNLHGYFDIAIEQRTLTDDAESLFDS